MPYSQSQIRENIQMITEKIRLAAVRAGRSVSDVRLVVVTKSHPISSVRTAIEAGARILGENYAEEGLAKIQAIGDVSGVEWHMIGHVQSRKASEIALKYTLVHSVDSQKLVERINRIAMDAPAVQDILIQVNVSGEESKSGLPCWDDAQLVSLMSEIQKITLLPNVRVRGFMTIPPVGTDADSARPYFQRLVKIRNFLAGEIENAEFTELSMGMSADFEAAVEEGATLVRVGTAILGERIV